MPTYYVNKQAQSNGDHEVHESTCSYLPSASNLLYLGVFTTCSDAVKEAKKTYSQADGCYWCCRSCHTS
jgi:hypothetical protein